MHSFDIVPAPVVAEVLGDRQQVLEIVRDTYLAHGSAGTTNPASYFLSFEDRPADRIIALPSRIHTPKLDISGIKWISSFPANIVNGLPRASAVLILNDMADGYPYACLEAACISAARTAASAALTLQALQTTHPSSGTVSVFGAGVIAREILSYIESAHLPIDEVLVCDLDTRSAEALIESLLARGRKARAVDAAEALAATTVITATNAGAPYLDRAPVAGQVYLNVSLRDFTPASLAAAQNLVDDVDHCLKANTSPHLTEQLLGHREFVTGTIPELLAGDLELDPGRGVVISPFGLGVLDLAVGEWVHRVAVERELNVRVPEFFGALRRW
jgi:2,3-diaminopropionate biosynthesis protein SbnB